MAIRHPNAATKIDLSKIYPQAISIGFYYARIYNLNVSQSHTHPIKYRNQGSILSKEIDDSIHSQPPIIVNL